MKSTIRNFTTAFFAWSISIILLFVYLAAHREETMAESREYFLFAMVIVSMSVCAVFGLAGLFILSILSHIFNWSEGKDYCVKLVSAFLLYLPIFFAIKDIFWLDTFWYWSFAATLLVITFDYKHLFKEHLSIGNKQVQTENH